MSVIKIEGKPVDLTSLPGSTAGHLYLILQDDSGNEIVIRGGPGPSSGLILPDLVLQIGIPIDASKDSRTHNLDGTPIDPPATPADRGDRILNLGSRSADDVWNLLVQQANNVQNQHFTYTGVTQNSNTVVGYLLSLVGINVDDVLPNAVGIGPLGYIARGTDLNFDFSISGTIHDDIIDGRKGDQVFYGRGGNDTLDGGDGRDIAGYSDSNPANYDIRRNNDGSFTVRDARGSAGDGTDTLENMESLQFFGNPQRFELQKNGLSFETDFAFVIDTTGSMGSSIGGVKAQASNIIDNLFADGKTDARIGIVGFKDTTDGEPSSVILPFTDQDSFADRKTAALDAINGIGVGGGGDIPETDYDGLILALNGSMGDWRFAAGKHDIVLFTDAPVKDTGLASDVNRLAANVGATVTVHSTATGSSGSAELFTLSAPSAAASATGDVNADGTNVNIYSIFLGPDGTDTSRLSSISASTGGAFFTASGGDDLAKKILDIINLPADQTLIGTDGDDTLIGGAGKDFIQGLGGNDTLQGLGGTDYLEGDAGADNIDGGDGFDLASWLGETSGLTLNLGNQSLNAGSAAGDMVSNVEAFYLTNSADSSTAGATGIFLYGFDGNDTIVGSDVSDVIDGGPGADTIDARGGFDYISYYSSANPVTVDLKNPANNTGDAAGDTITNAEAYILTSKDDTFVGSDSGQNIVFGYEGNDTMIGGFNANNYFIGGDGDNRMVGGGVRDLLVGGSGVDTIVPVTPTPIAGSSVFNFTAGQDKLEISRAAFGLSPTYAVNDGTTLVSGTGPVATTTDPTFFYYTDSGLFYFDPDGAGATAANLLMQFAGNSGGPPPALSADDFKIV